MRHWKITIRGPSIQGVMLRELIVGLKDEPELAAGLGGIKGFARNFEDWVEVVFQSDKGSAELLLAAIRDIPTKSQAMGIVRYEDGPKLEEIASPEGLFSDDDFRYFRVKRDNEQKEMMLALQGAGKLFKISADIQRTVSEQLRERDEKKVIGLLLSLYYESDQNREAVRSGNSTAISTVALEQGVTSPPIPADQFVNQITEVFGKLREYQRIQEKMPTEERNALIKLLDSFKEMVRKELGRRDIKVS